MSKLLFETIERDLPLAETDRSEATEVIVPLRPAPTPEQAALGIIPAAIGDGSYESIMRVVKAIRSEDSGWDQAIGELWDTIAEDRAVRRAMVKDDE